MTRVSSEEAGTRAFDILCLHSGGVNRRSWLAKADLTASQLNRGLDWLRELFDHEAFVKNWIGREWIYMLAVDDRAVREHAERQLRTQITRARRDYNWWHNIAGQHPGQENERQEEQARRRLVDLRYAYDTMFAGVPSA